MATVPHPFRSGIYRGEADPSRTARGVSGATGSDGAADERYFLAALIRAGLDPRDGRIEVEYALALAEEQATRERRDTYTRAYLNAIAAAAGYHGSKEAWQALEDGMKDAESAPAYNPAELAQQLNVPIAEIEAALATGWIPPAITVTEIKR